MEKEAQERTTEREKVAGGWGGRDQRQRQGEAAGEQDGVRLGIPDGVGIWGQPYALLEGVCGKTNCFISKRVGCSLCFQSSLLYLRH